MKVQFRLAPSGKPTRDVGPVDLPLIPRLGETVYLDFDDPDGQPRGSEGEPYRVMYIDWWPLGESEGDDPIVLLVCWSLDRVVGR